MCNWMQIGSRLQASETLVSTGEIPGQAYREKISRDTLFRLAVELFCQKNQKQSQQSSRHIEKEVGKGRAPETGKNLNALTESCDNGRDADDPRDQHTIRHPQGRLDPSRPPEQESENEKLQNVGGFSHQEVHLVHIERGQIRKKPDQQGTQNRGSPTTGSRTRRSVKHDYRPEKDGEPTFEKSRKGFQTAP